METVSGGDHLHTTEDDYGVRWGRSKVTTERFKYYDCFYLDGEEFSVKDTVYLQASHGPPYIARIAKLCENVGTRAKYMLVHWFFRPCELPEGLRTVNYNDNSKEIFMAVGTEHTKKLQNPASTIKKCRVVCIANETWNRVPSAEEVAAADHVFHRAFNPVKLRLERLDPSKENHVGYLALICSDKGRKVGSFKCSGQAEKENGVVPINRNPGLQSKKVIMGKPPKYPSERETDQTRKLRISQMSLSEVPSIQGKAPQHVVSGKRPRIDILQEHITRKSKLGGTINEKERSLKLPGKQDFTTSEKRRKIDHFVTGEGEVKKAHLSGSKGEMEKGKLNSQLRNPSASPLDTLSEAQSLDGQKNSEKNPEGSRPLSSCTSAGKEIRDGEAREAAVLGKRCREEIPPSGTVQKKIVHHLKPEKRVDQWRVESAPLRPHVSSGQKASSSLKPKRSDGIPREGLKEECRGANLKKSTSVEVLREAKLHNREGECVRKQQDHQHRSSTSIMVKSKNTLKTKGTSGISLVEHISRSLAKGDKIRVTADNEGNRKFKPKSHTGDVVERFEQASNRDETGADFHRIAEGRYSAMLHGRALSTENQHKPYMPNKKIFKFAWNEKSSVEEAIRKGRALELKNLDPYLNSIEIEAILENVLDTTCDALILPPRSITCYKSAEAIVIFKKAEIAEDVLRILTENVLVISEDERPVLASTLTKPTLSINNFHGFFKLEQFGWKMNNSVDQRNVVATSHCAQVNTVEYDMGLHWRVLQERATLEWVKLEEDHQREVLEVKAKYRKS